jgi:hypothetical protein
MLIKKYGIILRTVEINDAEFILSLRSNEKLGRFISPTDIDIEKQRDWIKLYKKREEKKTEFYFITIDEQGNRYGVNRIYNFDETSFESGSWLFSPEAPVGMSILSDLIGRSFAFEDLGYKFCRFEVKKDNFTVVKYSKQFNLNSIFEDDLNYYFRIDFENFKQQRDRLVRMLVRNK